MILDNQEVGDLLEAIQSLPEYQTHVELPDLHLKDQMEAPSSTAVATGEYIIPTLASAAINDGMSIMKLPWRSSQMSEAIIEDFFKEVNSHAAKTKFSSNKYSITKNELKEVCLFGAEALLKKFDLDESILDAIELRGRLNEDLAPEDIKRLVPRQLLTSSFSRCEMGLNFRGNHFLEVQSVDEVVFDAPSQHSFEKGDITVMSHLGPGPFTGNLLRLYTNRMKIPLKHRMLYFLAKVYFHFLSGDSRLTWAERRKFFFRPEKYQSFHRESQMGRDFWKLIQIGTNYGFAYQLATFAAVRDAVRIVSEKHGLGNKDAELVWNVSHNSIYKEFVQGKPSFVTRHNSVKIYDNRPTILAGSYDVNSCIGWVKDCHDNKLMNTHDHGIGSIIQSSKDNGTFRTGNSTSRRYFLKRGEPIIEECRECLKSHSQEIIEVANELRSQNVLEPWLYLSPMATLKN